MPHSIIKLPFNFSIYMEFIVACCYLVFYLPKKVKYYAPGQPKTVLPNFNVATKFQWYAFSCAFSLFGVT